MESAEIWSEFMSIMEKNVNQVTFNFWIKNLKLHNIDQENNRITIIVPMPTFKVNLKKNWSETFESALFDITGITYELKFVTQEDLYEIEEVNEPVNNVENPTLTNKVEEDIKFDTNLKKELTFDNYVVGETNRFAKTTAMTVAQQPGKIYNPLFIYGKCGVGKTHLMQAIGNFITENTNLKVLYTTSAVFRDDYINITAGSKEDIISKSKYFKNKYWNVDVLIIDDIQFLAGAEKTQMEFFQIFEDFIANNKQLVISSDTSPKDLTKIEERLKSRLTYSLPVDIFPPDFDLKCRILREKIKKFSIANLITDDAIEYIASLYEGDVRPLEGAINRIQAYTAMYVPKQIDLKFTIEALGEDINKNIYANNSIRTIQSAVADKYEITVEALIGKKRSKDIAYPRMIAMYLSRMLTEESFPRIGLEFGGRDHSTVIHAVDKINSDLKENKKLQEIINEIKNNI